ncbi:hypothetical protein AGMMS50256_23080 [Betaproteobacteria bacterium]|nr:hypothetical protein AGMMS50256_23080 [Betaproteobacteria bacterium]
MRTQWIYVLVAAVALSLSMSVSAGPSADSIYGAEMSPAKCLKIAEQAILSILRDPDSAQFKRDGGPCRKGSAAVFKVGVYKEESGYKQFGKVNAKNSYGGYVGFKEYAVLIRNDVAIYACIDNDDTSICRTMIWP